MSTVDDKVDLIRLRRKYDSPRLEETVISCAVELWCTCLMYIFTIYTITIIVLKLSLIGRLLHFKLFVWMSKNILDNMTSLWWLCCFFMNFVNLSLMWRHLRIRTLLRNKYHRPWSDVAHNARRLIRAYDIWY